MCDCKSAVIVGLTIPVVIIIIIVLSVSNPNVDYYEYGFVRWRTTGVVDTSSVYETGTYFLGPDAGFKVYPKNIQRIKLTRKAIFTADKLEVWITMSFQYVLRREGLPFLHKAYDKYYEPVLESNAQDALKNAAVVYSTREYLEERAKIEEGLKRAVTERLGGICCGAKDCTTAYCIPGCKPYDSCQEGDMGLFAIVRYFQLMDVKIPEDVANRFMKALTLQEEAEAEKLVQKAAVIRKETQQMVEQIKNEASEIIRNATSYGNLIESLAETNATAQIENARATGLRNLYERLGLTEDQHKMSLDYLQSVRDMDKAHLTVNFNQVFLELQSKS